MNRNVLGVMGSRLPNRMMLCLLPAYVRSVGAVDNLSH